MHSQLHNRRFMRRGKHRGFTLTELLGVMVIMAVLAAVMIPGLGGVVSQSKLTSAAGPLVATLGQARQYAIANGHSVHVIIPHAKKDGTPMVLYSNNIAMRQRYLRSYVVYSERDGYLGDWNLLPDGLVFNPVYQSYQSENLIADGNTKFDTDTPLPYPDPRNPSGAPISRILRSITFRADGSLATGIEHPVLVLCQGVTNWGNPGNGSDLAYEIWRDKPAVVVRVNGLTGTATTWQEEAP